MAPFVGRRAELAHLQELLAAAVRRTPHVVQVDGPGGIGKTALLDRFLADPGSGPPPVVLRAGGDETETLLPYGVVDQLARAAGPAGAGLREAIGIGGGEVLEDPVTVGTRLLALLDRAAAAAPDAPVVLVLDDAQWADAPSLQAVVFVLRRLVADPVLAVVAVRDDGADQLPAGLRRLVTGHRGSRLRLSGLAEDDLRRLVAELGIDRFPVSAVRSLHAGTRGNPLHAVAVLEEFPPGEWGGTARPLPAPRSFRLLVRDRHAACAEPTRRLVEAAAVMGQRCPLPLAAALGEVADPLVAADDAAVHGLLQTSGAQRPWTVAFPHPLVRSAIYDGLGAAPRSALHRRAAELLAGAGPVPEAAVFRHRIGAAVEPDEALAADLDAFAGREAARQAWPSAVGHLVEAARLSPDGRGRPRLLRAVSWLLQNGDAAAAAELAAEVSGFEPGPLRDGVMGSLAMATGDPARAADLLADAWAGSADEDPETRAAIAFHNAVHRYGRLDGPGTAEWCARALALTGPDTPLRWAALTYRAHGLAFAGRTAESFAVIADVVARPDDPGYAWLEPRSARGLLRLVEDDLDGAREDLEAAATVAGRLGVLNTAAYAFAFLARAEYLAGEWDAAVVHADRAAAINEESDLAFTRSMVLGVVALVPAGRGDWAAAEAAIEAADVGGYERSVVAVGMSRARLAEARGDAEGVLAALDPVRRFPERSGVDEPGFWAWADLYAEALTALGRHEEAGELLRPHEEAAAARGRRSSIARFARARGRVEAAAGRPDAAAAAFDRALEAAGQVPLPFERARTRLAAGAFHRRAGRRRLAADLLGEAQEGFVRLGAEPYVAQCAKELAASGLDPARSPRDRAGLTAQELVVARLAAEGRSNRDIAAELVVSVKTVEYHLRNVFPKLGLTSRRQLRDRLAQL